MEIGDRHTFQCDEGMSAVAHGIHSVAGKIHNNPFISATVAVDLSLFTAEKGLANLTDLVVNLYLPVWKIPST